MTIGLVSDTHGYFDPKLRGALRGAELIVHAGDVGPEAVLDELREIAPVHAVRGNVDSPDSGLPLSLELAPGGAGIRVLHILPAAQSDLQLWAESARAGGAVRKPAERLMHAFDPSPEMVVFGHSHRPCLELLGGILWVNPGSAGRKRFSLPRTCALVEILPQTLQARIVPLEDDSGGLPESLSIDRALRR
ncbi:MAG TPA: metallophosphoesterase family protein [Terriglobia bacterium]|jgi:putative phosphoesterase|nr:metallophosphoesterase family protein [Terriglobia bacterium]